MKLLEDIGMHYPNKYCETKRRFGVYECPICLTPFRWQTSDVTKGIITQCKDCSNNARISEETIRFIIDATRVHEGKYDYSLVEFTFNNKPVAIICPEHGVFLQTPSNHLNGSGCRECAKSGFDQTKSATLYYLKVTYNNLVVYKIGITNRSVQERFSTKELKSILVLQTWEYPLGLDAYQKEQEILKLHSKFRYKGKPILTSGNTELFSIDILGLDQ